MFAIVNWQPVEVWQLFSTPDHRSSIVHCQQTSLSSGRKGPRDRKLVWRAPVHGAVIASNVLCGGKGSQLTTDARRLSTLAIDDRRLTMRANRDAVVCLTRRLTFEDNFVNRKSLKKRYLPGPINAELHADYESWYRFLSRIAFLRCYFWFVCYFLNFLFFHYSILSCFCNRQWCPTVSLTVVQYARPSIVNCPLSTNVLVVWPQRTSRPQVSLTRSCDNDWAVHREVDVLCGSQR